MSLEQQIGALVKASENLTGAVNGKIGEIDKKVNVATSAVPEQIRKSMYVTCYVDAINGDDSRSGDTHAAAKRTIQAVLDSAPSGAIIWCSLKDGQEHLINTKINASNKTIIFSSWNYSSNKPTIRVVSYIDNSKCMIGTIQQPMSVHCYYVHITIDDYLDTDSPLDMYARGFVSNGDRPANPTVTISSGNITHSGFPLLHSAGRPTEASVLLSRCSYIRRESKRTMPKLIECAGGGLYLYSVGLSNATHKDLVNLNRDRNGVVMNWNSNYDLAATADGV
ncbi:hypothetical protein [Photobacterium kishitanii]|uniref:hypothetical protein n=1 Tax=Photobacterium kishitanii TaxID=318456 RepID=UPI0004316362|nr:hypothetical protein [Photobacterium kishitanii]CEO39390.1 hypothetical protein PPBDW_I21406 [Photobacterium kishitanii]